MGLGVGVAAGVETVAETEVEVEIARRAGVTDETVVDVGVDEVEVETAAVRACEVLTALSSGTVMGTAALPPVGDADAGGSNDPQRVSKSAKTLSSPLT